MPLDLNSGDVITGSPRLKGGAAGGNSWAPIYDVDFTKLAFQSFTNAGKYTIQDVDWWAKNPQNGNWQITANGWEMNALNYAVSIGYWDQPSREFVLPLVNLKGWNPKAMTQAWVNLQFVSQPFSSGPGMMFGVCDTTSDSVGMTSGQMDRHVSVALDDSTTNISTFSWTRNNLRTSGNAIGFTYNRATEQTIAMGVCLPTPTQTYLMFDNSVIAGNPLPPKEPILYGYQYGYGHAVRTNPCLWLAPSSINFVHRIQRLTILQPAKGA